MSANIHDEGGLFLLRSLFDVFPIRWPDNESRKYAHRTSENIAKIFLSNIFIAPPPKKISKN